MKVYFTVDNTSISQIVSSDNRMNKGRLNFFLINLGRNVRYVDHNGNYKSKGDCLLLSVTNRELETYGNKNVGFALSSIFRAVESEDYCIGLFSVVRLVDKKTNLRTRTGIAISDRNCLMDTYPTRIELDLAGIRYEERELVNENAA